MVLLVRVFMLVIVYKFETVDKTRYKVAVCMMTEQTYYNRSQEVSICRAAPAGALYYCLPK